MPTISRQILAFISPSPAQWASSLSEACRRCFKRRRRHPNGRRHCLMGCRNRPEGRRHRFNVRRRLSIGRLHHTMSSVIVSMSPSPSQQAPSQGTHYQGILRATVPRGTVPYHPKGRCHHPRVAVPRCAVIVSRGPPSHLSGGRGRIYHFAPPPPEI